MGTVDDAGLAQIMRQVQTSVRAKTREVHADLTRSSPVDTGRLRADWTMSFESSDGGLVYSGIITNRVNYLPYVVNGRGWVYPVRARALHWVGPYGEVFAMSARPTQPNDFIDRVLRRQSTGGWRFRRTGTL